MLASRQYLLCSPCRPVPQVGHNSSSTSLVLARGRPTATSGTSSSTWRSWTSFYHTWHDRGSHVCFDLGSFHLHDVFLFIRFGKRSLDIPDPSPDKPEVNFVGFYFILLTITTTLKWGDLKLLNWILLLLNTVISILDNHRYSITYNTYQSNTII